MCLFALSTTACNFDFFNSPFSKSSEVRPTSNDISVHDARKIATPATSDEGFGDTPQINFERKGLKEPLGLNNNMLFADKISNEDKRFDRLENAVQRISDTVNKMDPTVKRLAKVEQDLEELTEQLEILITQDTITPRVRGANAMQMAATNNAAPQNVATQASVIRNIRLADHKGKTRIVIESAQEINYSAQINGNMLSISYNGAQPSFDLNALANQSKFTTSVSATPKADQNVIILQFMKDTNILKEGRIPPNKDNANHRIYIDVQNNIAPNVTAKVEEPLVDK